MGRWSRLSLCIPLIPAEAVDIDLQSSVDAMGSDTYATEAVEIPVDFPCVLAERTEIHGSAVEINV